MNKLVYVASPVQPILDDIALIEVDMTKHVYWVAEDACKIVKRAGHIPISPVLLWRGVYRESEREKIMQNCKRLLRLCDEIYVVKTKWTEQSKGIKQELEWAKEFGILQVQYEG